MKPKGLKTKIFLDSGDPKETREALGRLDFLDGQTTNPTLLARNPEAAGKDPLVFYRETAKEIFRLIPRGSISLEVYAHRKTKKEEMIVQAREMFSWIPNAHIKLPLIKEGLKAAQVLTKEGIRVNITLCFSQEQAGAVMSALKNIKEGQAFLSPFVGRLDDKGVNGMELIENILRMKKESGSKVEVLTASVRNLDHLLEAIRLGSGIVTSPLKILKEWAEKGLAAPSKTYRYPAGDLKPIPYQKLDLTKDWENFNIDHPLTEAGLEKFVQDWKSLI